MLYTCLTSLVLASASPRRQKMLQDIGLQFDVVPAEVDEAPDRDELPKHFVSRLAGDKAVAVARNHPHSWVLAADTVVVSNHRILGKPENREDAFATLAELAGNRHQVWTGYCICNAGGEIRRQSAIVTEVLFAACPETILHSYVRTGEPLDKAGAYGIQGLGGSLVREIHGSYSNVVGLPLAEVLADLLELEIITAAQQ